MTSTYQDNSLYLLKKKAKPFIKKCTTIPQKSIIMYYKKLDDDGNSTREGLDFIDIESTGHYNGVSVMKLTDSNFNIIDNAKISWEGKRIVIENSINSTFENNQYVERGFLEYSNGDMVEFTSVYSDSGTTSTTESPSEDFLVLNGTGIFSGYNTVSVFYDNDGTELSWNPSGKKQVRKLVFHNV